MKQFLFKAENSFEHQLSISGMTGQ